MVTCPVPRSIGGAGLVAAPLLLNPTWEPSGRTTQPVTTFAPRIFAVERYSPDGFLTDGNANVHVPPAAVIRPVTLPPPRVATSVAPSLFFNDSEVPDTFPQSQASILPSHR